jgi:hypothetical protein
MSIANQEAKLGSNGAEGGDLAPMLIDLGKKNAKDVKKLRKGKGKLVEQVQGAIAELKSAGTISMSAQPIIVVVTEKTDAKSVLSMLKI